MYKLPPLFSCVLQVFGQLLVFLRDVQKVSGCLPFFKISNLSKVLQKRKGNEYSQKQEVRGRKKFSTGVYFECK
jgi:hypothetical protein